MLTICFPGRFPLSALLVNECEYSRQVEYIYEDE